MTAVALPVQDRNLGCRVEPGHVLGELFDVVEPLQHRLPGELRHPGGGQIAANGGSPALSIQSTNASSVLAGATSLNPSARRVDR